jgi:hypothetical protein
VLDAGQLSEGEAAPLGSSGAVHDVDSGTSDGGSMEREAAVVRTSTAGSNSLQVRMTVFRRDRAAVYARNALTSCFKGSADLLSVLSSEGWHHVQRCR